jgi:transposase InsO family protein
LRLPSRSADATRQRFGEIAPDAARGIALRHDWGPQHISGHFHGALRWLGIEASPAFAGEPPCNGCAERFIRTLKEQCLWARTYADLDDLRTAVQAFVERYNIQWLIVRYGHKAPREAYAIAGQAVAA